MSTRACLGAFLVGSVLSATAAVGQDLPPLPTYEAHRAVDAITVDGRLDEATWALVPRVGPFRLIHAPDRAATYSTEATLAWDGAHLYVAFACTDSSPWGRYRDRDDRLWEEEVVEVFLDPDGNGREYAEFEVSPLNVVVDLLIAAPRASGPGARQWNAEGWQTAVTRHAAGWVVEMAIPWTSLARAGVTTAPRHGDTWRVGLYRITRPGGPEKAARIDALVVERRAASDARKAEIDRALEQLRADDEYAAWSVTHADLGFHDPERFGTVRFVER